MAPRSSPPWARRPQFHSLTHSLAHFLVTDKTVYDGKGDIDIVWPENDGPNGRDRQSSPAF